MFQGKCEEVTISWGSFLWGFLARDQQAVFISTLAMVKKPFPCSINSFSFYQVFFLVLQFTHNSSALSA